MGCWPGVGEGGGVDLELRVCLDGGQGGGVGDEDAEDGGGFFSAEMGRVLD